MGRLRKYETKAQKMEANRIAQRKFYEKNKDRIRAHNNEVHRKLRKSQLDFDTRIEKLETDVKEILLTLDEVLKENKKLADLIKYGKRR